jgi:membrane protease YdiL (CAAX protease family)
MESLVGHRHTRAKPLACLSARRGAVVDPAGDGGVLARTTTRHEEREFMLEEDLLQGPEDDQPGREVIIIFAVFFEGGLAPLSLLLGWLLGHPPLESFAWSMRAATWGVLAAIPFTLLFLAMLRWPIGPLKRVKNFCDNEVVPLLDKSTWSEIALISLSAGVGEEMLFRGVVQASLSSWLSWPAGLTLASLLFGLLHPISVTYMIIAAILGLYLGAVWIASGNLLTVMVTHALYDFAALAYLLRIRPAWEGGSDQI